VTPFVARSAAVLRERQPALGEQAARLLVRANLSIAAGRPADAGELLEQVTVLAPGYTGAHFLLGQHYEAEGKHELARTRYLRVLQAEPAHVIALNNLAYNLAVHAGKVAEALPIAERAARLAPDTPEVLDTVGWIRHLAGDSRRALDSLRQATSRNASMCESWAHLAVAERAAGSAPAARAAADKAISCDPALGSSALLQDVKNW
jgi:tetratricopeptide (TPR) repeat protein